MRSSKCVIVDSINKQVSNLDLSTSIPQQLIDNLVNANIEFHESLYSIRSVINEFLVFKEKNKILIRDMESIQKEKSNQRGKIFNNFISKDALDVDLVTIANFLPWLDCVLVILDKVGSEADQNVVLNQIRRSLKNQQDSLSTKNMTSLNQVIGYLKARYLIDPRLGPLSLTPLRELRPPQTIDQSLKNISVILP